MEDVKVVGQAGNGVEALTLIDDLEPHVALLDVQMPGLTGFEVAHLLIEKQTPTHVVFVTAYDQYAVEAFEVNAVDYLLKPVEQARLEQASSGCVGGCRWRSRHDRLERLADASERQHAGQRRQGG